MPIMISGTYRSLDGLLRFFVTGVCRRGLIVARALSTVGLLLFILGLPLYLTGLKDRLSGPGLYTWVLKRNRRATQDMVDRVEGMFYRSAERLCLVGRWMTVCGIGLFLVGYGIDTFMP